VIDAPVTLSTAPAGDVIALDLWDEIALPADAKLLQVEPRRWWLIDAGDRAAAIAAQVGDAGALTPIGGGLVRATLTGPGWRALLTLSGCFDSENPNFTTGQVAATIIHHVPVWIAVTGDSEAQVYMASSYAPTLIALWTQAIGVA
jgi:heterotetrameric sarcosine oxidase gamma subunit